MRIEITDPISGRDVKDLEHAPYVVEGDLKIFFESEDTKRAYLDIEVEHPGEDFEHSLDNPAAMGPGDRR